MNQAPKGLWPELRLTSHERLNRLRSLELGLPDDNAERQKDQHNKTFENYCKFVLELAGERDVLYAHFIYMVENVDSLSGQQLQDVFTVWAPVAEVLGDYDMKTLLEDMAFERCYPVEYAEIEATYQQLGGREELDALIAVQGEGIAAIVQEEIDTYGYPARVVVSGRRKSPYSVYRTGKRKGTYLLPDYLGIRMILELYEADEDAEPAAIDACYLTAAVLLGCLDPVEGRYKDYISQPKPNGYQSIHLTLRDIDGAQLECQVRTRQMHMHAEHDPNASHIMHDARNKHVDARYVNGATPTPLKIFAWRDTAARELARRKAENDPSTQGLFPDSMIAFSEVGNAYELKAGSTVLDFAFEVHSAAALGLRAVYRNGNIARYTDTVEAGDVVTIEYAPDGGQTWGDHWFAAVTSGKARRAIGKAVKRRDKAMLVALAEERIESELSAQGLHSGLSFLTDADESELASSYGVLSFDELLVQIQQNVYGTGRIKNRVIANARAIAGNSDAAAVVVRQSKRELAALQTANLRQGHAIAVLGTHGCNYRIAGCCTEIAHTDQAVATVRRSSGDFSVHKSGCVNTTGKVALSCSWFLPQID